MSTPPSNVVAVLMRKKDILHILKEMKWALVQKTLILKWSVLLIILVQSHRDKRADEIKTYQMSDKKSLIENIPIYQNIVKWNIYYKLR